MTTQLQKKIQMLADQQNHIARSIHDHARAINAHAELISKQQNAIENIMVWLGHELGGDAVDRLKEYLGVKEQEESGKNKSDVLEH